MRGVSANHRLTAWLFLVGLTMLVAPDAIRAQPYPVPDTWGGDIFSRPRLTGDWDGSRDELAKKGIVFDLDLLLTPQVNMSDGRSTGGNLWGNLDYTLNIDTQKLGLWPGGFFNFQADTGFGSNIFHDTAGVVAVNTAAIIPGVNDRTTALMNATLTQFLSPQLAVFGGKINTLDSGYTEFYGDYRTQFLNSATSSPMALEQVPISTFGGGVIVIPREDILLSATVLGPSGTPDSNDPDKAFNGVMVLGSGQLTVKPFGLVGHQSLSVSWNDQGSHQPRLAVAAGVISPARQSGTGPEGNPGTVLPEPADPGPAAQSQEQQLGDELRLRSVFLAARRQPEARNRPLLRVRCFRRKPQPDRVLLSRRDRR
jgi:porin